MNKPIVPFALAFLVGAATALVIRSARHEPYEADAPKPEVVVPANTHHAPAPTEPEPAASAASPVNNVCPICGMDVDPDTPTAMYKGQVIGLGCRNCPAEFAANPALYGEAALQNKVVEE